MTDAHCHVSCGVSGIRELIIGRDFLGVHPWETLGSEEVRVRGEEVGAWLEAELKARPKLGVGEIGLDRLKERTISPVMREVFSAQLKLACEYQRPVVLHGAKCWGEVVKEVKSEEERAKKCGWMLFHGFSRSAGLIPEIVKLGGYISVGPAILNDHAVNYRALVKSIPLERLLIETDRTPENAAECPSIIDVLEGAAKVLGLSPSELEHITDANLLIFSGVST